MNFRFLYDPQRRILSIGYRLADAEGPGRLDLSYYDLLASEARLASFIGIAKGDLPETHWFHLGRLITSVDGRPTLLSWSATLFEYLMPLLVMRSYPETLLDQTCRMAVRRQLEYGVERGVPWGMSESAYNLVDLHDTYQYKAFGVPGLGLKRGLGDELVVAPYATALASMLEPALAAENFRRLAAAGLSGSCGYYEAIDYTHQRMDASTGADLRRTARRAWWSAPSWRITRACRSSPCRMPCSATGWWGASTPTRGCRPPNFSCRSGCRGTRPSSSRDRSKRRTRPRRSSRRPFAASARRTRGSRTRSSSPTGTTSRWSPTAAAARASAGAAR